MRAGGCEDWERGQSLQWLSAVVCETGGGGGGGAMATCLSRTSICVLQRANSLDGSWLRPRPPRAHNAEEY